ncbi:MULTISPECIES: hypothetical protein [unclassified Streptomyces]|uniref:hypothetical protein n=1 Tax=unclassified Streptomyces TaxID=2593676 RepID=UPI0022B60F3A|nr:MULTISPECIES: hypothetical protein [unclassified Streptomyces]MCZ7417180.1 hypothetical protein [Streptomyces sp. WMMC897]MCZ7432991.1 hypothetical protein [Streptomyces sp. WMMC1477]
MADDVDVDEKPAREAEELRRRPLSVQRRATGWAHVSWIGLLVAITVVWDEVPPWLGLLVWPALFVGFAWGPMRRLAASEGTGYGLVVLPLIALPCVVWGLEPAKGHLVLRATGERAVAEVDSRIGDTSEWKGQPNATFLYAFHDAETGERLPGPERTARPGTFPAGQTVTVLYDPRGVQAPQRTQDVNPYGKLGFGGAMALLGLVTIRSTSRRVSPAYAEATPPRVSHLPKRWWARAARLRRAR